MVFFFADVAAVAVLVIVLTVLGIALLVFAAGAASVTQIGGWRENGFWKTYREEVLHMDRRQYQGHLDEMDEMRRRTYESNQSKPDFLPKDPRV